MDLLQQIVARAKSNKQRIVLPEATEERTLTAADRVIGDDVADIILIGNPDEVYALADKLGLKNIRKATLIDPENNPKSEDYQDRRSRRTNLRCPFHYWRHLASGFANHQVCSWHHMRQRWIAAHLEGKTIW